MGCILVIEDEPELRGLIEDVLENAGFEVRTAANGNEGIKRFAEQPCQVVITDILMPEKEGYETIMELKQLKPDVTIIAISGGGRSGMGDDILRFAKTFGAQYTMTKPIVLKDLVALVQQTMPIQ